MSVFQKIQRMRKLPEDVIILDEDGCQDKKPVKTEDLGKIFEMAICLLYKIPFDGKYKYSIAEAETICVRINNLLTIFPYNIKHTAKNGNKYDFSSIDNPEINLSAKTTKKDGKVCPQVIGQPSREKFCTFFNVEGSIDVLESIKTHIEKNVCDMLKIYFENTFDCPIIYYNKHKNILKFVKAKNEINWNEYLIEFSHKKKNKEWCESSTISIAGKNVGEFQVHNNRNCVKFRWFFENLLRDFAESFDITNL
jgi:hypothetical protein